MTISTQNVILCPESRRTKITNNKTYTLSLSNSEVAPLRDAKVFDLAVGQNEVNRKMKFFVNSHSEKTPFPTMLLTGSHGLGKTFFSSLIARALGRDFIEVNAGSLETATKFIEDTLLGKVVGNREVTLLIDEAHVLKEEVITTLLTLLNPNKDNVNNLDYKSFRLEYDMSKINIIFATTDAYRIFKPLRNRCEEIYFYPYEIDELLCILYIYLEENNALHSGIDLEDVGYACRGRARDALLLAQNINRYCTSHHTHLLTPEGWEDLTMIFGICSLGLNKQEYGLMEIVRNDGPISAKNLAVRLMVNQKNVEEELEIRPKELGLIESTTRGRVLTNKGIEYMKRN